jgi:hypothetical protein
MPAPLPAWIEGSYRFARYPEIRQRQQVHRRILSRINRSRVVLQGPFSGMSYLPRAYCSEVLPKLVGTYECELIPAIETMCRYSCDCIVDIGAAEGYYAVGMALRNPSARVVAFELSSSGRFFLHRLAALNQASHQIAIKGECTVMALRSTLADARRPALICDCEGAEDILLRPDQVEPLARSMTSGFCRLTRLRSLPAVRATATTCLTTAQS